MVSTARRGEEPGGFVLEVTESMAPTTTATGEKTPDPRTTLATGEKEENASFDGGFVNPFARSDHAPRCLPRPASAPAGENCDGVGLRLTGPTPAFVFLREAPRDLARAHPLAPTEGSPRPCLTPAPRRDPVRRHPSAHRDRAPSGKILRGRTHPARSGP
jgi:hypothetical protein